MRAAGGLADEAYAEAEVVRVVLDNLNTHQTAFLYGTFPAGEAQQIAKRLGFHYPPKHGSWLNPALSLPKGWRRSSQRTVSFLPQAMASRDGIVHVTLQLKRSVSGCTEDHHVGHLLARARSS